MLGHGCVCWTPWAAVDHSHTGIDKVYMVVHIPADLCTISRYVRLCTQIVGSRETEIVNVLDDVAVRQEQMLRIIYCVQHRPREA